MITTLVCIYGFIGFCSLVGMVHPRLRRPEALRVRQAINSWWPPSLVGGVAVLGGRWSAVVVFCIISLWTLREYLHLIPAEGRHRTLDFMALLSAPLHYAMLATGSLALFGSVLLVWTFAVIPLVHAAVAGTRGMMTSVPRVQWGVMLTVLGLSHVPLIALHGHTSMAAGMPGVMTLLMLTVMANDAAQYVAGKALGRRKLAPSISPNKTWEGFAGGLFISTTVAASAAPTVTNLTLSDGAAVGAVLALLGLLGDLLVSAIKRDVGAKDTGSVLPGQGGVLDRCDSLLLTAPAYAWGVLTWLT